MTPAAPTMRSSSTRARSAASSSKGRQAAREARARARRRSLRRQRRRRMLRRSAIAAGVVAAAVLALVLVMPLSTAPDRAICVDDPSTFPARGVAGWQGEQLEHAATIVQTATALGLGRDAQILGVMTAMGESSLRNIDYGDWESAGIANPDGSRTTSIGLFQQQDWWGSVETRMDPASAATLFFQRLVALDGWQQREPSHAIHAVQINTDPEHYARFATDAAAIVDAFSEPCPAPTDAAP